MPVPNERNPEHHVPPSNQEIAARLEELAKLLEVQGANLFRVRAYRTAAQNLRALTRPVHEILSAEGHAGLLALRGIGRSLARAVEKMCRTGRLPLLQRLRGEAGSNHLFLTLPGIGLELASRIHEQLGVDNLFELQTAARAGRLSRVPGFGRKRVQAIQEALRGRIHAPPPRPAPPARSTEPPHIEEILSVDKEYREKAAAGQLRLIAPKRFNPGGIPWLPVLHTHRENRHYTALYSNTARAHELGTTHDWVVVYRDDHDGHGQWTVITSQFGHLRGRRIIRGLEAECDAYYSNSARKSDPAPPHHQSLLF
jgi:putative hydrolase